MGVWVVGCGGVSMMGEAARRARASFKPNPNKQPPNPKPRRTEPVRLDLERGRVELRFPGVVPGRLDREEVAVEAELRRDALGRGDPGDGACCCRGGGDLVVVVGLV